MPLADLACYALAAIGATRMVDTDNRRLEELAA